ncbi:MAG: thioesterase family protein [Alphaproteobacteria bacterium]
MKATLKPGITHTNKITIDKDRTISFMGDELRVYGTPFMVRDMEATCRDLLLQHHDAGEDSVGARIEVDHLAPTLIGQWVEIKATVTEVEGQRVKFDLEARDALDAIGRGKHIRFTVDKSKQGLRLQAKAAKVKAAAG